MSGNTKAGTMLGVLLDRATIDTNDIDFADLESIFSEWRAYDYTSTREVHDRIADAVIVVSNKVMLDEAALRSAARLRCVCIAATGTNNVDLQAAKQLGIPVSNVRGYATPAVIQHVFALILALTTRLSDYHRAVLDGRWQQARQFCLLDYPIRELQGKTLGIVGYGELGRGVATIAEAFGMNILAAQRPGGAAQADRMPLDALLPQVDILSLHCPLTPATQGLIGERELALMKRDAVLINTARGGIVDEQALAEALRGRRLGGAGVDVLTEEPPIRGNPLLAADIPNLIITPHSAWASRETRQRVVQEVATNIHAFLDGAPRNLVI
ncbi:MAG: 2-hydroxyacid dehydrogenase [Gammaproteobacteria bacterium]|nr:2-hydroxyacid dehydrogenase [Gammaproteobacteria bacterium]